MKTLVSAGLKFENNRLLVLNQQALPQQVEWLVSADISEMIGIIKTLKVRGAPLIGVAAALAVAQLVEQKASHADILAAAERLRAARPTAVNLSYCIDRLLRAYEAHGGAALVKEAETIFEEDARLSQQMAERAAIFIKDNDRILTHCNTGGLVTTGIGTALGAIILAHQQGKKCHVYVDETRPLLQGARLTAWECLQHGISHQIICDSMAAGLMKDKKIDSVFVGADRIAANGDFANKIGTYSLAVAAHHHRIPLYVVAPYTTVDPACKTGDDIRIEHRDADEVRGARGAFGDVTWSPAASGAYNPAFDVTPASLVAAIILDHGVYDPKAERFGVQRR